MGEKVIIARGYIHVLNSDGNGDGNGDGYGYGDGDGNGYGNGDGNGNIESLFLDESGNVIFYF